MDNSLYKIMENLKMEKATSNTRDIHYLGTISLEQNGVRITKDVIAMINISDHGDIFMKYYDETGTMIAARGTDGELYPSKKYSTDDLAFLNEIDNLDINKSVSLEETNQELDKISRILGIDKERILRMSKAGLDVSLEDKENDMLTLAEDDNKETSKEEEQEQNEAILQGIAAKQQTSLDKKVDNKHTLAEILGVPVGSTLIAVDSSKIENNETTTRFDCIIKRPDGTLERPDNLNQIGGKNSDKNIYETNRDGSKVEKRQVQSSFAIDSPLVKDGIINIRYGQMGNLEISYGQMDRTSHRDAFAQRLETSETYPVTREVRDEFNPNKGIDNVTEKIDEIEKHENCDHLTLKEADGIPETGHIHGEEAAEIILANEDFVNTTNDSFGPKDVAERFESIQRENPSLNRDELIELTKADLEAEHLPEGPTVH